MLKLLQAAWKPILSKKVSVASVYSTNWVFLFLQQNHLYAQFFEIIKYHSTCFGRSFRPSSGIQDCKYSITYMSYILVDRMLAGVPASMRSTILYDINLMLYVQSWRKDRPKHVEWYSINSKNCAFGWFYYRNISRCTVPWK